MYHISCAISGDSKGWMPSMLSKRGKKIKPQNSAIIVFESQTKFIVLNTEKIARLLGEEIQ